MMVDMPPGRLQPFFSFMHDPDYQRGRMSKPDRQVSKTIKMKRQYASIENCSLLERKPAERFCSDLSHPLRQV
jgi:hypothetical protein